MRIINTFESFNIYIFLRQNYFTLKLYDYNFNDNKYHRYLYK